MFRIKIDGKIYKLYTAATVSLTYDTVASSFSIDSSLTKEGLAQGLPPKPLSYKSIEIDIKKRDNSFENLLTGTITGHSGQSTARPGGIRLSGYTKPGVLVDCSIPKEAYPLQDDNKSLREITKKLLAPFGIGLVVNDIVANEADKIISQASASETSTVASYIVKLASQNNIIVGHLSRGLLLFTKARANEKASSTYIEGQGEVVSIKYEVDGRAVHSRYTVLRQPEFSDNTNTNPEEIANVSVVPVFRPLTKKQTSGGDDVTQNAATAARMAGLKKAIKYELDVSTLYYQNGEPIRPNRIIKLKAPSAFLENETRLFVIGTTLTVTSKATRTTLTCVLAEALTGRDAQNIF